MHFRWYILGARRHSFHAGKLNLATLQLDSLKSINPSFHHNDTTITYMEQIFNSRAKFISDSLALIQARADSVTHVDSVNKERKDSINAEKYNLLRAPIIRKLEKSARLFCSACKGNHFEQEDLSGYYLCCGASASLDIDADSSGIKVVYKTPVLLDNNILQLMLEAMSNIVKTLEPTNQISGLRLKDLLLKAYSSGHSETINGPLSIFLDTEEGYSKTLQRNMIMLTCKVFKKLN